MGLRHPLSVDCCVDLHVDVCILDRLCLYICIRLMRVYVSVDR